MDSPRGPCLNTPAMGKLYQFPTQQVRKLAEWDKIVDELFVGWDLTDDVKDYARDWLKRAWRKYATDPDFTFSFGLPEHLSEDEREEVVGAVKAESMKLAKQNNDRFNQMLLDLLIKELELYLVGQRESGPDPLLE